MSIYAYLFHALPEIKKHEQKRKETEGRPEDPPQSS
jgi:hypothetical protein